MSIYDSLLAKAINGNGGGGGGASWDAVIHLTHAMNSEGDEPSSLTPSIVEGSFDSLYSKLSNGGYPCILVEYEHLVSTTTRFSSPMGYVVYFSDAGIIIAIAGFSPVTNSLKVYGNLYWSPEDEVEWS